MNYHSMAKNTTKPSGKNTSPSGKNTSPSSTKTNSSSSYPTYVPVLLGILGAIAIVALVLAILLYISGDSDLNLTYPTRDTIEISAGGSPATLLGATDSQAGLLIPQDKSKLNGITASSTTMVVYVNQSSGNDNTAVANDVSLPFQTVSSALVKLQDSSEKGEWVGTANIIMQGASYVPAEDEDWVLDLSNGTGSMVKIKPEADYVTGSAIIAQILEPFANAVAVSALEMTENAFATETWHFMLTPDGLRVPIAEGSILNVIVYASVAPLPDFNIGEEVILKKLPFIFDIQNHFTISLRCNADSILQFEDIALGPNSGILTLRDIGQSGDIPINLADNRTYSCRFQHCHFSNEFSNDQDHVIDTFVPTQFDSCGSESITPSNLKHVIWLLGSSLGSFTRCLLPYFQIRARKSTFSSVSSYLSRIILDEGSNGNAIYSSFEGRAASINLIEIVKSSSFIMTDCTISVGSKVSVYSDSSVKIQGGAINKSSASNYMIKTTNMGIISINGVTVTALAGVKTYECTTLSEVRLTDINGSAELTGLCSLGVDTAVVPVWNSSVTRSEDSNCIAILSNI